MTLVWVFAVVWPRLAAAEGAPAPEKPDAPAVGASSKLGAAGESGGEKVPDSSKVGEPSHGAAAGHADNIDAQLYGGILVSAVGAALLVVAGVAVGRIDGLETDPGFVAYRDGFRPNQDVCQQADAAMRVRGAASPERVRGICDKAAGWEIASYVALPGGIAMLGMGLYLTLTSDTAQVTSPVALLPIFGPTMAGLTVSGQL